MQTLQIIFSRQFATSVLSCIWQSLTFVTGNKQETAICQGFTLLQDQLSLQGMCSNKWALREQVVESPHMERGMTYLLFVKLTFSFRLSSRSEDGDRYTSQRCPERPDNQGPPHAAQVWKFSSICMVDIIIRSMPYEAPFLHPSTFSTVISALTCRARGLSPAGGQDELKQRLKDVMMQAGDLSLLQLQEASAQGRSLVELHPDMLEHCAFIRAALYQQMYVWVVLHPT